MLGSELNEMDSFGSLCSRFDRGKSRPQPRSVNPTKMRMVEPLNRSTPGDTGRHDDDRTAELQEIRTPARAP